jgi:hypothetical protein
MGLKPDWRLLAIGVALILYGLLFVAERLDVLPPWALEFRWWPLVVIVIGLSKLIQPRDANEIGSGVQLTFLGLWFLVASNEWFGLSWQNSWPLALVAAGAGMVVRSMAAYWLPDKARALKEDHHA